MSLTRSKRPFSPCSLTGVGSNFSEGSAAASCSSSFFCSRVSFFGRDDGDCHEQVAPAAPADVGHAAAPQAERRACARPLGHLKRLFTFERRDPDFAPERQRREVQRNLAVQIVAVALEKRMLLHVDDDVQISSRPAGRPGLALAGQTQTLTCGDSGRNFDGELPLLLHASGTAARRARLCDDRAGAAAGAAGARERKRSLLQSNLSAPLTLRARRRLRPGRRAAAMACAARFLSRNLNGGLRSLGRFVE